MLTRRDQEVLVVLLTIVSGCWSAPADVGADGSAPTTGSMSRGGAEPITSSIPPAPPTLTTEGGVIETQQQIYIISGVFGVFLLVLLIVSLSAAYAVISLHQKVRTLQGDAPAPGKQSTVRRLRPAGAVSPAPAPTGPPARGRPAPQQGRDNRGFGEDDDEDSGDEVVERGYRQYPGQQGHRDTRGGRPGGSPGRTHYDRFHQPMPDQHMPSEERQPRRDHPNSRYGAGNLARLPKGPAPQPSSYDRGYQQERRPRSPVHSQW